MPVPVRGEPTGPPPRSRPWYRLTGPGRSATQKWSFTTWPDESAEVRSAPGAECLDDRVALGLRALPCTGSSRQKWG